MAHLHGILPRRVVRIQAEVLGRIRTFIGHYINEFSPTKTTATFYLIALRSDARTNRAGHQMKFTPEFDASPYANLSVRSVSYYIEAKKPVITLARLENEGVVVTYQDAYATWPVTTYEWQCGTKTATSTNLRAVVAPTTPVRSLKVKGRARDYFLNWGEWCAETAVELEPPLTPVVAAEASELGTVAFSWQNCQTVTNIAKYIVAVYASSSAISSLSSATPFKRTSTNALFYGVDMTTLHDDNGDNKFWVYLSVKAVDKWGLESAEGYGEIYVQPPLKPVVKVEKRIDGLYLVWQDCKTTFNIKKYVVWDLNIGDGGVKYDIDGTAHPLVPRAAKSEPYSVSVQAIDVAGLWSPKANVTFTVLGVSAINGPDYSDPAEPYTLTAKIDGSDIVLEWEEPASTWPIAAYQIYNTASVAIGTADTLFFRFPAPVAGAYEYSVRARDLADNWGPEGRAVGIEIKHPALPVVKEAVVSDEGIVVSWASGGGENTLPIVAWDVQHWWEYDPDGDGTASTAYMDLGRLDADHITIPVDAVGGLADSGQAVPALLAGKHWIHVRAVDTAGNTSRGIDPETEMEVGWTEVSVDVESPGKVSFQNYATVDNNIMLYWSEPDSIQLPIAYYLFEEIERYEGNGETTELAMEIGRIDARFASTFEVGAGRYVYAVTPVDMAGNRGERASIAVNVQQPPDFILYHNWPSLFSGGNSDLGRNQPNGGRTNFILDGEGHMLGPYADATWNENLAAIASAKGVNAASVTWSQKTEWSWERWTDPAAPSATYVEIVDVLDNADDPTALIPSTSIRVNIDSVTLAGSPVFTCQIETSEDAQTWKVISTDALTVYASNFRYVRYTIGLTGGAAQINGITYKLDVKRKSDFGRVRAYAQDTVVDGKTIKANGDNWTSMSATPMLTGTWVDFHVEFTDVESLPRPGVTAVYDSQGTSQNGTLADLTSYSAYTVFEDVLNPAGFRVFVLDKDGNRVTADVDWSAYGV